MGHYDDQREADREIYIARLEKQRQEIVAAIQKTLDQHSTLAEALAEILYDPWNYRR